MFSPGGWWIWVFPGGVRGMSDAVQTSAFLPEAGSCHVEAGRLCTFLECPNRLGNLDPPKVKLGTKGLAGWTGDSRLVFPFDDDLLLQLIAIGAQEPYFSVSQAIGLGAPERIPTRWLIETVAARDREP